MLLFDQFNENVLNSRVSVVSWPHISWFLGSLRCLPQPRLPQLSIDQIKARQSCFENPVDSDLKLECLPLKLALPNSNSLFSDKKTSLLRLFGRRAGS